MNKKEICILAFLFILIFSVNYSWLDPFVVRFFDDSESVKVERIIDGDTIVAENQTIRLLGINTPERGERFYSEAKEFLENEILNESVILRFGRDRKDFYGRTLAYVFFKGDNVNLKQVENGLANYYFPSGKDIYFDDFGNAWRDCLEENRNLCEASVERCTECIELKEFDFRNEKIVFYNSCDFSCDLENWEIKDEGRKKFVFPGFVLNSGEEVSVVVSEEEINEENTLTWIRKDYVWTDSGDTLFLRDKDGKLVLWENY